MTVHRQAPDWPATGDTAATIMTGFGSIATIAQPEPRNGPGWTDTDEETFQRFVYKAARSAENYNMLPPRCSRTRWLIPPRDGHTFGHKKPPLSARCKRFFLRVRNA